MSDPSTEALIITGGNTLNVGVDTVMGVRSVVPS